MSNTADLIASLSAEAMPTKKVRAPAYWAVRLLVVLVVYAAGCQLFLGLRPDLEEQFARLLFVLETLLLALLLITSAISSVLAMYPDAYQKQRLLKLPYAVFALLLGLIGFQLLMPNDARMVIPEGTGIHAIECAICIASVALVPSALIFALLRKGATVRQLQAGSFAVLAASAIGGLTLRLAEENDSIMHLVQWHYVPTLLFATLGALVGKWLLKW
jgi:hypothetical protein